MRGGRAGAAELEHEVRDHGAEVGVADALAVAVDRPLHLARAGGDGRERVRDRQLAVVVDVDADRGQVPLDDVGDDRGDLVRLRAAVRVAEDDPVRARTGRRLEHRERVAAVRARAVEEVLGVDDDLAPVRLQQRDRVGDHREVLVERRVQDVGDVEVPRLGDDRDRRRPGGERCCRLRSSSARIPAWRVLPKALSRACRSGSSRSAAKNCSSFGFAPGQPPST